MKTTTKKSIELCCRAKIVAFVLHIQAGKVELAKHIQSHRVEENIKYRNQRE